MPSQEKIKILQNTLNKFATGSMNFAKDRITMEREEGGMGLFDVETFLTGQQASWILKSSKSVRDNWRSKLRALCNGNVLCAGKHIINQNANPILYGLSVSYEKLRRSHDSKHCNFTKAIVFNNTMFFRGPGDKLPLDLSYLELEENRNSPITKLEAHEYFNVHSVKTKLELQVDFGLVMSLTGYARLVKCLNHYVYRLKPNTRNNGSSRNFSTEFLPLKNPGKKIRKCLAKSKRKQFELSKTKSVVSFLSITNLVYPEPNGLRMQITIWNIGGISNRVRVFFFKFYNNLLGLNTRLSHFVANQSRGCNFCEGSADPVPDETFIHVFLQCPTSTGWRDSFLTKYFPFFIQMNDRQKSEFYLLGKMPGFRNDNLFIVLCVLLFQYCIWEERLKKKKPSFRTIENIYLELLGQLVHSNSAVHTCAETLNFPICRTVGVRGAAPDNQPWRPGQAARRRLPAP
jgi:hypothetical protein